MENRQEFSIGGILHIICEYHPPNLPEGKAGARIEKTLAAIAAGAFQSAEAALPTLAERYAKSTDPHKALRHRPLCLALDFSLREEKQFFSVTWSISLSRAGRTLSKAKETARFDKQSGRLLSGREKKSMPKD